MQSNIDKQNLSDNKIKGVKGREDDACRGIKSPSQIVRCTKRLSNKERLRILLQSFKKDDRVLIVIVADPDAMASAFAIKRLLARRVEEVTIAHQNEIMRVNNIAMKELLKIPMQRLRSIKKETFTKFILLDSQPLHNPDLAVISYHTVIDHHPVTEGWTAQFIDIRPEYGATSTIVFEYLKAAKIKLSVALSTALFYGIKSDTQNFTQKATQSDILCFRHLFKGINQQLLNKIETSDLRRSDLKYLKLAFENMKVSKQRIYTHIDKVTNPDMLVVTADFLTHVHDIGWVIVSGVYGDKLIVIFRCDGYKKDAGKLAARVFGAIGSAGGHKEKARAEIPLKNLTETMTLKFTTSTLQRLVLKHLH
ncbi:MAG: DHH family phosphoesterase [Dissulfurimicrobium sp.]|uniref:DHH family phosphoesterase n=1 Tax=Dissulfurimicrobium sp. TaxID=2022436 RepID=UPI00404B4AF9